MITTTKYALKKPEIGDTADLRVFVGDNMEILDAHKHVWADITDKPTTFTPPIATTTNLGGVIVGTGLTIDATGTLSTTGGGGTWDSITDKPTVVVSDSTGGTGFTDTIWTGTQAQYDSLIKDPNTLYYIVG